MTSKNVARYESINNENLKGWHTGAGMSNHTIAMSKDIIVITSGRQPI